MNTCQLTATITAIANAFSKTLSVEEIGLLAAVLVQLGDTLATIALQRSICEAEKEKIKTCASHGEK